MNRIGKIRIACFILVFLGSLMFGMLSGHAVDMSEKEEGKGILITTITYGNNYERNATASWTNPQDACIAENQYYDRTYHNGSYNGHSYDAHCASTTANYNPGTAFNMKHWFDVDLGGTYDVANVALGLSCGDKSGESNKVNCYVELFNYAGKNVGTFNDTLNITGTMNKYFLNKPSGSIDKFTNIKKIRVSVANGAYGSIGIPTNIYYINVYRKIKVTDPGGKFTYSTDSTELTYGTTYESFQIDTYYDTTNPPVITYNDGSDAYFTAEHWVSDATYDYIRFKPKKITGEDYYTITVSRAASRTYEAASFTVRVKINPKPLKIDEVRADNKTYDGTTEGSGSFILEGIANDDDVKATGTFTFADKNVGTRIPVSVANIVLSGSAAGNYRLDTTTESTTPAADILALPITITANAQTITYGGSIATGTGKVTVATLATGDSLTAITLKANGTNAGTWSITPSAAIIKDGDADVTGNYNISYVNGLLIINRVPVDKPKAVNHTYNGTVHFGVNPQTAATGYTYSGVIQESGAGTYTVTATLDGNHMWSDSTTGEVSLEWSIARLGITITAKEQKITYGGNIATGLDQVTVATLVSGDSLTAITLTAGGTNAGTQTITPSAAIIQDGSIDVTSNYSITYVNGNLVIAQKEITPKLVAEDRLYNGTTEAKGTIDLPGKVIGDDVSATYVACTFNSPLVGTWTATATGIALIGSAASNYTLKDTSATDAANITKAVLTVDVNSDWVNTAQEALIKEKTARAGTAVNIKLPASYTIENANGSYGNISDESYARSGVYYNALGVIEDTLASELVMENIPCVAVTYHITTGQNAVYGDNTTDTSEQTTITTYVNSADSWQIENKTRKIATNSPATATLNVYLKEGEHLLVDTAIGVYYGRMDVTVTKVKESTVLAEDKIDAFFPVNFNDDFRVSKLNEAKPSEELTKRGDYWEEVVPFTAPSTGVYTFTITVTGKSYLHTIDERYTQNLPAQKPVTELKKFTINGTEMHGIDA